MKFPKSILNAIVLVTATLAGPEFGGARAQNLIINGSFENTASSFINNGQGYMVLVAGSTAIPGWTVTNDQITWLLTGDQSFGSTLFGSLFLDLTGTHDNGSFGGVAQTITTTTSQAYTVSVSIGVNQNDPFGNGSKSVSVTAGSSNVSLTFAPLGTGMQWTNLGFNFVATSSSTLISILGASSGSGNQSLFFDNVSVMPAVPSLKIGNEAPGQATISWIPDTPGYLLQESLSFSTGSWSNSPSASTNPITVPTALPAKFYRLAHP